MIYAVLSDGTRRSLDKATVTLTWEEPEGEKEYKLADVQKLVLVEPTVVKRPGVFGGPGGIPVVGLAFQDLSDLSIEVPLPAAEEYVTAFTQGILEDAEKARMMSKKSAEIQARSGDVAVAQSMADVSRVFGSAPARKPGNGAA